MRWSGPQARPLWLSVVALAMAMVTVAVLAPVEAQAEPARLMPLYRADRGTTIDDPVQVKAERRAFEAAYEQYRQAASQYQADVQDFIAREVKSKQAGIMAAYQPTLDALDLARTDARREAIARLESFVLRHRDHETYTPDTLFRLAELYYEDTKAQNSRSTDNSDRDKKLYDQIGRAHV